MLQLNVRRTIWSVRPFVCEVGGESGNIAFPQLDGPIVQIETNPALQYVYDDRPGEESVGGSAASAASHGVVERRRVWLWNEAP